MIQIKQETDRITLNSVDLKISNVRVTLKDGSFIDSIDTAYFNELEIVTFLFKKKIPAQDVVLEMEFVGELNDKMKGFYRSKYFATDSEERYAAVTQFEATDARRAFPCFDEPSIKATFSVSITIPQNRVGISNMPIIKEEFLDENMKKIYFATSPIMSTYCELIRYHLS